MASAFGKPIHFGTGKGNGSTHLPGNFFRNLGLLLFKVLNSRFTDSGALVDAGLLPLFLR
jgi:hypothetical protein